MLIITIGNLLIAKIQKNSISSISGHPNLVQGPQNPPWGGAATHLPISQGWHAGLPWVSPSVFSQAQALVPLIQRQSYNNTHLWVWHSYPPSHQWWLPGPEQTPPPPARRRQSRGGCSHRVPPETPRLQSATSDLPGIREEKMFCWNSFSLQSIVLRKLLPYPKGTFWLHHKIFKVNSQSFLF